jgi:LPXTG-motif cell wall-anchored protein
MNAVPDIAWFAIDQLPKTGVKITVMVFGGLTLLILGGGLFLASRRQHRPPPPPGFKLGETGQPGREGGEPGRPGSKTGGAIHE